MSEVRLRLVDDITDGDVVTVEFVMAAGVVRVMGEPKEVGGVLHVRGVHVASEIGPNGLGLGALRRLADLVMEDLGYDGIILLGEARTGGAGPGRRPGPIRFSRRGASRP